jgi:hypothetical protein
MESRHWIAVGLLGIAAVAMTLAFVDTFWMGFAAIAPILAAMACLAPRSWSSSTRYRRAIDVLACASLIAAAVALAAAVGFGITALIAVPAGVTFVLVMWQSREASSGEPTS